jgi:superfamily II DNA/RNA helicase
LKAHSCGISEPGSGVRLSIMSDQSFDSLKGVVSDLTLDTIKKMGFSHMTEIQSKSIPSLLEGRCVLAIFFDSSY